MTTKQEVMNSINDHLGLARIRVSSGSTEPKVFFEAIVTLLAIPGPTVADKPGLAKAIVEGAGLPWLPEFESRGSTVTLAGLEAVYSSVLLLVPLPRK
jgi:hypothetical protein